MLILKNINKDEQERIQMGNLLLLHDKLVEAEEKWKRSLYQGTDDHRFTQGVASLLSDLTELLPKKTK